MTLNKNITKMKAKTEKQAYEVICALKEEYADGVIKDYMMAPLFNIKSGEQTGFVVFIQLANKYEYTDDMLNDWKQRLQADEYSVTANHNQLTVKFSIHYDKEEKP